MFLPSSEHKKMLWKNGAGFTREIDRWPKSGDDFDWRLSLAKVDPPGGPFSIFPQIDRTICVVNKQSLTLTLNDSSKREIKLDQNSAPYSFAGETPIECRIVGSALNDFNVMTRRTKFQHQVERIRLDFGQRKSVSTFTETNEIFFLVLGRGRIKINEEIHLEQDDAFRLDQTFKNFEIFSLDDDTEFFFVRIKPITTL